MCLALVLVLLLHLDKLLSIFKSPPSRLIWSPTKPRDAQAEFERLFLPHRHRFKPATVVFFNKTTNVIHALVDKGTQNKPVGEHFSQMTNFNKIFEKEITTIVLTAITLFS